MMRSLVLAATLVAAVAAAAPATTTTAAADADAASTGPAPTISLDAKTFDEKVSFYADDEWLLEFYAPWCTHCQHFAPTYDKIARTLDAVGKRVAKIDCVASKPVCTRFGVSAFPTIKLVRGSGLKADAKNPKAQALAQEGRRVYDFSGERTLEGVVAWVQNGYASATSDAFPKPGEAIESAGSISKLILAHPYLSGAVLGIVVLLLLFFVYIMCDSMRDEEEEAKAIAKARAEKDAAKAQKAADIHAAAAADDGAGGAPAANATANGNGDHSNGNGAAAASPKRRTQRAD